MRGKVKVLAVSCLAVLGAASAFAQETTMLPIEAMLGPSRYRQSAPPSWAFAPRAEAPILRRPRVTHRARERTKVADDEASSPLFAKTRTPGEASNPVPALLKDATLRVGDIVMFPDGPRVFTGRAGDRHAMRDFAPVTRMAKLVPRDTRKFLAEIRPSLNVAWEFDNPAAGEQVAANIRDVETTGSVRRARR